MPLNDVDIIRRRLSVAFPTDLVEFILYSYNEHTFDEKHFQSVHELLHVLENCIEDDKSHWIEVINRSSVDLPKNIKIFCEHLQIHPLTMEDITTLVPCMKLDLFPDQAAVYLLMKIIRWNGQRVEQQQISFYLKCSQNLLITFQEKTFDNEPFFLHIRNRLHRQRYNNNESSPYHPHNRLKQLKVDYLFYCLLDAIIDRYYFIRPVEIGGSNILCTRTRSVLNFCTQTRTRVRDLSDSVREFSDFSELVEGHA
jgi:Mg2+ and Co2+ transporter CorA